MPTAIIIDDSRHDREALKKLLEQHPDIVIEQECDSAAKGIKAIEKHRPDLVFLDVEMPEMDGLQMLAAMGDSEERDFAVIFITSYSQYAVDAFDLAALHYILKPIDPMKFDAALDKFRNGMGDRARSQQMEVLRHNLGTTTAQLMRMAISYKDKEGDATVVFGIRDIAYCCSAAADGAKGAYTTFFFAEDGQMAEKAKEKRPVRKLDASKSLNHFEKLLGQHGFIRMGRQYLINPEFVTKVEKDLVVVTLGRGVSHELSVSNANRLLKLIGPRLLK